MSNEQTHTMRFSKYTKNLQVKDGHVWSYTTKVARIESDKLVQLGWWSMTTQKHINYAAQQLGLELDRGEH